jgi:DNA-binding response OmpR family regulator
VSALLDAKSVLLAEDQFLIAMDTEHALLERGAADVRVVPSIRDALHLLESFRPDVAVLDFMLADGTAAGVAEALTILQVPFVFATGYGDSVAIPAPYSYVPVVRKPYSVEELVANLNAVMRKPD